MTNEFADGPLSLYTLQDLVELAGAKASQIQNWVVNEVFTPQVASTGTGAFRAYTFEGLVYCAVAVQLSQHRMPAPVIKSIVRNVSTYTSEFPTAKDRRFLKAWRKFINPATRAKDSKVTIFATPGGRSMLTIDDPTLPRNKTYVVVDLGTIIRELEQATGDSWLAPTGAVGTPPPRKRRSRK